MINAGPINSQQINGAGGGPLVPVADGVGSLAVVAQRVGKSGVGSLAIARQTVRLIVRSGAGSIATVSQSVVNSASGQLATVSQRVRDPVDVSNLNRFGWDVFLYIGGKPVPASQITGMISVRRAENSAALMDVTIRPPTGTQDLQSYHGKSIILNIETPGKIDRVFTGVIDIPEIDLIDKTITLRCTDRRRELINAQFGGQLKFVGRWSPDIFEGADDVFDELEQRLTTTPKSVDFDGFGNVTVSDYFPKSTPDFVLPGSTIYRRRPVVRVASRARLVNTINLEFEMRYARLRQRKRNFELRGPSFCEVNTIQGLAFILVDAVTNQLKQSAWPVDFSSLTFTGQPTSGVYNCGGGAFIYNTIVRTSGQVVQVTDENGTVVTDSNGNPLVQVVGASFIDLGRNFAEKATWTAAYNFAQDISEKVNIKLVAPQSVAQYGTIEKTQRNGRTVDFDTSNFEENEKFVNLGGTVSDEYFTDKTGDPQAYKDALQTQISIGETTILKSHRANDVEFERSIWPELQLRHTVEVNASQVQARGKVAVIEHMIDVQNRVASTSVKMSLSQSIGTPPTSSLAFPLLNAPLVGNQSPQTIRTYSYDGDLYDSARLASSGSRGDVIGLITPPIDNLSRNRQEYSRNFSLDIPIRNDLLVVNFNE